jgi:hypothetical protein
MWILQKMDAAACLYFTASPSGLVKISSGG